MLSTKSVPSIIWESAFNLDCRIQVHENSREGVEHIDAEGVFQTSLLFANGFVCMLLLLRGPLPGAACGQGSCAVRSKMLWKNYLH